MITQVEAFTSRVFQSPLPTLSETLQTDPIQIRKIDGLGPVPAILSTGKYGSTDGEYYTGSSLGKRNIVLTIGLNPDWADQTIEFLRQILYTYFMPKKDVKLRFTSNHMATVEIDGYVESMDPNIFTEDPEIQVSIICPKPDFIATNETIINGVTLALPDGAPTIVEYQGSVPSGFNLKVVRTTTTMTNGELRVINENPDLQLFIIDEATISSTRHLELNTVSGNKYVREVLTSSIENILGSVTAGSKWLQLEVGTNNLRVASEVPGQDWSLGYYARFGGI